MPDDIDPREFTVPASDGKGHSERIWVRISPGHDRQLGVVVGSAFFPYRSKGDVIRHAMARHLVWLETLAPIPSISAQVDAITEIIREEEFDREFNEVITKMGDTIGALLGQGQTGRARGLLTRVLDKVDRMPEGEWRDMYRKTITDRFSGLVDGTPVKLRGDDGD